MSRPLLAALILLAVAACGSGDEEPSKKPAPPTPDLTAVPEETIPPEEIERGKAACQDWAAEACRCAESQPDLADTCAEAKKIPEALEMAIRSGNADGIKGDVRARLQLEARRIIGRCISERAKIACP